MVTSDNFTFYSNLPIFALIRLNSYPPFVMHAQCTSTVHTGYERATRARSKQLIGYNMNDLCLCNVVFVKVDEHIYDNNVQTYFSSRYICSNITIRGDSNNRMYYGQTKYT